MGKAGDGSGELKRKKGRKEEGGELKRERERERGTHLSRAGRDRPLPRYPVTGSAICTIYTIYTLDLQVFSISIGLRDRSGASEVLRARAWWT